MMMMMMMIIISVYFEWRNWDIVVNTVSRPHTGWSRFQISARAKDYSLCHNVCSARLTNRLLPVPRYGIRVVTPPLPYTASWSVYEQIFLLKRFTLERAMNASRIRHSSTLSLTSALDGGWWLTPRPGCFTPRSRDPASIIQETGWASGPVWMATKISSAPAFDLSNIRSVDSGYIDWAIPAHQVFLSPLILLKEFYVHGSEHRWSILSFYRLMSTIEVVPHR